MAKYNYIEYIDGKQIPFSVFVERRDSVRVSFGRSNINVRIPSFMSTSEIEENYQKAIKWVEKQAEKDPSSLNNYLLEDYDNKKSLHIYGQELNIDIQYSSRKSGKGNYDKKTNTILLDLPNDMYDRGKDKMIKHLLSRVCAGIFQSKIEKRVLEINDKCFHKDIKSVRLKYNKSNWGSCSSASNINLSTRLLFAPNDVIDYVIIHELAHLYEMNHSDKFWDIVSQVMPSYMEKEKWLDTHGSLCDF